MQLFCGNICCILRVVKEVCKREHPIGWAKVRKAYM